MDFKGKKVVVVGMGVSGLSAARLLKRLGARVSVTDLIYNEEHAQVLQSENIPFESEGHTEEFICSADILVVSPGVPKDSKPFFYAAERGIPVVGEVEIACQGIKNKIIAITGTNGKTTTTTLIDRMLKQDKISCIACGNIGTPVSSEIEQLDPSAILVIEVSSFQLETICGFSPHLAVLLNVSPDHCDRYVSEEEYLAAKLRIFENQNENDWAVVNHDDFSERFSSSPPLSRVIYFSQKARLSEGAWVENRHMHFRIDGKGEFAIARSEVSMPGDHNVKNALAAGLSAMIMGAAHGSICEILRSFSGLKHRLELVCSHKGIRFYNDSKATNVDAVKQAVLSFEDPIVLIVGGRNKDMDLNYIRDTIKARVKALVAIGETRDEWMRLYKEEVPVVTASSMQEAVDAAWKRSSKGDVVLLSPACASFDMFKDYKDRGNQFKQCVKDLVDGL